MNAEANATVPDNTPARRTPSAPKPTPVSLEELVDHHNRQLPAFLAALAERGLDAPAAPEGLPIVRTEGGEWSVPDLTKGMVVDLIRKQNYRLGRFVRYRAIALLQEVVSTDADGRTVGRSYDDVLSVLRQEFPEGSTSAAALRWYVVHLWSEADDQGLPRPKMPQTRPRSLKARRSAKQAVEE